MFLRVTTAALLALCITTSTGCIGTGALGGKVRKFNLETTDHRWGREGLFVLLQVVYGFAAMGDLLVVNSIEFWTGTNPLNGKPSVTPISDIRDPENAKVLAMTPRDDGSFELLIATSSGERHLVRVDEPSTP